MTRPLCRYCAKPIPKVTSYLIFGASPREVARQVDRCREERPATREEAARYVNGEIVSVRYSTKARINYPGGEGSQTIDVPRYVDRVTTWDGESYIDEFFCMDRHAYWFGRAAARSGNAMPIWNQKMAERGG